MNLQKLKNVLSQGEGVCLEFKKSTSLLKPALETVCSFLNTKGGMLVFGVKDDGEIIGQNVTDKTKLELANEMRKIEPKAPIEIHYLPFKENLQIIVLEVLPGKHLPYVYEGRAFERTASSTSRMTQHHYEQLIINRGQQNHAWDTHSASNYGIPDLDQDEIRKMVYDGIDQNRISPEVLTYSTERILKKLQLTNHEELTNAAVVLFAKDLNDNFSQCTIKLARFRGNDKLGDFIDNQRITGNAFEIIRAADAFAARHLPISSHFEPGQIKRIDQPAVPILALREALINAICHRNYDIYSATISLAIYDDRLELWNAGKLSSHLRMEDLRTSHDSYPRNKKIAMVFYQRGWIEMWGTGTTRMIEYCKKNGTPEPEFHEYSGGFSVVFPFKETMHTAIANEQEQLPIVRLSLRQKEIIALLSRVEAMPLKEINKHLKNPVAERTLQDELSFLKKKGIVSFHGSARSTHWFLVKEQ